MKRVYPHTRRKEGPGISTVTNTVEASCVPYYHDTSNSPIGLWQLSGTLEDSSGRGNTLTLVAGTERYTELTGGFKGLFLDGSTYFQLPSGTADFFNTGSVSILAIVCPADIDQDAYPSHGYLATFMGGTGTAQADNILYSLGLADSNAIIWAHEYNTGTAVTIKSDHCAMYGMISHIGVVRNQNAISFFLNGSRVGGTSSLTPPPNGGGGPNGRFKVGGVSSAALTYIGGLASLKVFNYALTDAQVKAEFDRSVGVKYTIRTAT